MDKRYRLPFSLLVMSAAVAGAAGFSTLTPAAKLKPRDFSNAPSGLAERKASAETAGETSPFRRLPVRLPENARQRLDSVVGYNTDGSKYIRMYCRYGDDGIMTSQVNSFWDTENEDWLDVQELNYVWNDHGLCLMMSNYGYGSGERVDYTYNADDLCDVQIKYIAGADGVWQKYYKGKYTYDSAGNMTSENVFLWDGAEWSPASRSTATYDSNNLMTGIEIYECINGIWQGADKQEYVNYTANKLYDKYLYRWDSAAGEWRNAQHFIQEWGPQGHLLAQRMRFWNDDQQAWTGDYPSWGTSEICINYDAERTYDDRWRLTRQTHYDWVDTSGEKYLGSEMVTVWTDNADGTSQSEMNAYRYAYPSTEAIHVGQEFSAYNANDSIIWFLSVDDSERKLDYDKFGNITYEANWVFRDGERVPDIEERNTYDEKGRITEQTFRMNGGGGGMQPMGKPRRSAEVTDEDNEGWMNTTHFEYGYDSTVDIRTSKHSYTWDRVSQTWMPGTGSEVVYDFNVPVDEILLPLTYGEGYKIDRIDNYQNVGGEWGIAPQQYHYSSISSGVAALTEAAEAGIRYSGRILSVTGHCDDAIHRVYTLSGAQVFSGNGMTADLSMLAPGTYVVSSLLDGRPVTLKILCK